MTLAALKKGRVAVLMGGTSSEREVSLQSGETVLKALKDAGFNVFSVDPMHTDWVQSLRGADFAYIALHGPGGEDGGMQGALETLGIPYSGSSVLGSALAMDKVRSKQLWQGIGLPTAGFEILSAGSDWAEIINRLGAVFVKPACEGSSIGMQSAANAEELQAAFEEASQFAGDVIAEQLIDGPEYTVGILGDEALPVIRLETDNEFYDYDAKYVSDDTRYLCPCGLDTEEASLIAELSLRAFRALDCSVWGRVDLMRHSDGSFYLLEVNTIPGMTSHSLVPMAAREIGLDLSGLVSRVVALSMGEGN